MGTRRCDYLPLTDFVAVEGLKSPLLTEPGQKKESRVSSVTVVDLCERIREARGANQKRTIRGMVAKSTMSLQRGSLRCSLEGCQPWSRFGDVSYITTHLHLTDRWSVFRRLGCLLIPANGKDKLIQQWRCKELALTDL